MARTTLPSMHPGELLREEIFPAMDMRTSEIAERIGLPIEILEAIVAEEASVTAEIALRLGKFFGNGPEIWIGLQTDFDIEMAERKLVDELARIETIKAA